MGTFIRQIFTYNILKPFSYDQEYFTKHFMENNKDLYDISSEDFSHYTQIVKYGSFHFGVAGVIGANTALAAVGILIMIITDLLLVRLQKLWIRMLLRLFCFTFCIYKFDVFPIKREPNYLKFLFALFSLVSRNTWLLTYLLFIAFENTILI